MTNTRSSIPAQSWRNRSDWTWPDCKFPGDIQGEQPRIPCPPPTIITGSKLVEPKFFRYFVHLNLELAPSAYCSAASQGKGRTSCSPQFTPRDDSCFCTYICIHINIEWGAQIQSTVTSSSMLSLVCEAFQRREKYYKTNAEVLCNRLQEKCKAVLGWDCDSAH